MPNESEVKRREGLRKSKPLVYAKVMKYEEMIANGKSIAMMQIQPSYVCNMHCLHCSVSCFRKQKRPIMTLDTIKSLCNQMNDYGLAAIDLTGGEPLAMKNLVGILGAIGTERFYMSLATNGYYMEKNVAEWLKVMGIDRILLSLDSLNEKEHDIMRNTQGAYKHAIDAIQYIKNAGLDLKFTSVITHQRVHAQELKDFVQFAKDNGGRIEPLPPKLVGEWEGKFDLLLTEDDYKYLADTYNMTFHVAPHYGMNLGCLAVKKILTVTAYGDVMPCIWIYYSLGNIHDTPLKDIIAKGMRYFGKYHPICRMSEDIDFIKKYADNIKGKQLPVAIEEVL